MCIRSLIWSRHEQLAGVAGDAGDAHLVGGGVEEVGALQLSLSLGFPSKRRLSLRALFRSPYLLTEPVLLR